MNVIYNLAISSWISECYIISGTDTDSEFYINWQVDVT